jgi:hypothetical protein
MIVFRNCDRRWPFLWESSEQPAGRWHGPAEGPAQYFADTPNGAWAEFLRHEDIADPVDLAGIERAIWIIDISIDDPACPALARETMTGDPSTYPECQAEARRLRDAGASAIQAPSAALQPGCADGYRVELGFQPGPPRDGIVFVVFGARPDAVGWLVVDNGHPPAEFIGRVRPFGEGAS